MRQIYEGVHGDLLKTILVRLNLVGWLTAWLQKAGCRRKLGIPATSVELG